MPINKRFVTTTRSHIKNSKDGLSVIILCGSMGHRMKTYGPKSLLKVSDEHTIIEQTIENVYLHYPDSEIIVTIGFDAHKMIKFLPSTVHVVENQLYETTNIIEELRLALNNATNENVLIVHGDLIFNNVTLDKVAIGKSKIVIDTTNQIDEDSVGITVVNNKVTIFSYGLSTKWAYISYLNGKELNLLRKICSNRNRSKWYIFEALNEVVHNGGKITTIEPKRMQIQRIEKSKDWKKYNESTNS